MSSEFTAVVEKDEDWFIAYSPEIPGANGQGRTKDEALQNLSDAIAVILQDRREDGLRGIPSEAALHLGADADDAVRRVKRAGSEVEVPEQRKILAWYADVAHGEVTADQDS